MRLLKKNHPMPYMFRSQMQLIFRG